MFNKIADLHIHSFYSDGTMSPEDILAEALAKGVGLLSITDHDILEGSRELQRLCNKQDIQCISGVELDSLDNGIDIHILGYGMNLSDDVFCAFVEKNRSLLEQVSIKLVEKMQQDYASINLEDYLKYTYDNRKGGWKALHYLMEKGLTKTLIDGCTFYPRYGCTYDCVEFPSVATVCQYIHNAGGKAVLAHPGVVIKQKDMDIFKNEVIQLVDLGLDGIECYYPTHTNDITKACVEICKDRNLLITSGSDCHGQFQDTEIGEMDMPIEQLNLGDLYSMI
jgi:predicted metal-dependent phosphoesterase TrpH